MQWSCHSDERDILVTQSGKPVTAHLCACGYPTWTSLALVHMPEVEAWYASHLDRGVGPIRRLGVSLGAPGDRRAEDGTLWIDYPSVGGPSPVVPIRTEPDTPAWFCRHSFVIQSGGLPWVAASGAKGLSALHIVLETEPAVLLAGTTAQALEIPVTVEEPLGVARRAEPASRGSRHGRVALMYT